MNAQEAIDRLEKEIEHIESLIDERNNLEFAGYISEEQRMKDEKEYNKDKEALSIVLESAKVLHEFINLVPVDILDAERYPGAKKMYLDEEDLLIRSDVAEKIGIEEGTDE